MQTERGSGRFERRNGQWRQSSAERGPRQLAQQAAAIVIGNQQISGVWLSSYTGGTSFGGTVRDEHLPDLADNRGPRACACRDRARWQRARTRRHVAGLLEAGVWFAIAAGATRRPSVLSAVSSRRMRMTPRSSGGSLRARTRSCCRPPLKRSRATVRPTASIEHGLRHRPNTNVSILAAILILPMPQSRCTCSCCLATANPAAAQALCGALRRTIDEDRIWVYYSRAPLVPVLRQADMQQSGCAVALPSARTRAAVPEQEVWVDAARVLQRMWGTKSGAAEFGRGRRPAAAALQG